MKIVIGSNNKAKVNAVRAVFPNETVVSHNAPSFVSSQPFSDEETMEGAINRAKQSAFIDSNAIGIGLEGGVMYVEKQLYLCNWGALVTNDKQLYTASGARILLPNEIAKELETGGELGDLIDHYAQKEDVRSNEGAIGIFTNDLISRKDLFRHVVTLLKGQWEYDELKRSK